MCEPKYDVSLLWNMKGFVQCVSVLGEFSSSNDFAESSILGIPSSARHSLSLDRGLGARGGFGILFNGSKLAGLPDAC